MRTCGVVLSFVLLTSCQTAFNIRIENRSAVPVMAFSNDWHDLIPPGQWRKGPFPSKENGAELIIVADHRRLCYDLNFDVDRHGKRKLDDHHNLVSALDTNLQLHIPGANAGIEEETVTPRVCGTS
jgi:hypothetical protein